MLFLRAFDLSRFEEGTLLPATGRNSRMLAEKWTAGATTLYGQHVHGSPNFMRSTTRQAAGDDNFPFPQEVVASHLAKLVRHTIDEGVDTFEVSAAARLESVSHGRSAADRR